MIFILFLSYTLILLHSYTLPVLAQLNISPPPNTQPLLFNFETFLGAFFSRVLVFAIVLAGIFFLFKLITAGYNYLVSTGEPQKLASATKEITNAAIGLALIVSTYFLLQIIETIFGVKILTT